MSGVAVNTISVPDISKQQFNGGSNLEDDLLGSEAGIYSTFFRTYDPTIGRFQGVDPLADTTPEINPYQFALCNPLTYNDPTGALSVQGSYAAFWNSILSSFASLAEGHYESDGGGGGGPENWYKTSDVYVRGDHSGFYYIGSSYTVNNSTGSIHQINQAGTVELQAVFVSSRVAQAGLDFSIGFKNNSPFDEYAPSGFVSIIGLEQATIDVAVKRGYQLAHLADKKLQVQPLRKFLSISDRLGKSLGVVGAALSIAENMNDESGLTYGDAAKISLGLALTFIPGLGLVALGYAVADTSVQFYTGTSISDRLGAAVDGAITGQGGESNIRKNVSSIFSN